MRESILGLGFLSLPAGIFHDQLGGAAVDAEELLALEEVGGEGEHANDEAGHDEEDQAERIGL